MFPDQNKLADPAEPKMPPPPSPQEMATMNALQWWNGLAGIPPGQIFDMLKQQQQQGMPR